MKLTKVRITEFQSIQDTTEFDVGDVTCLVGKNEAGKTAVLKALYRLNPVVESDRGFTTTSDFPRRDLIAYEDEVEAGHREPAEVVKATFQLDSGDIDAVREVFGPECLREELPTLTLRMGYSGELGVDLKVDEEAAVKNLIDYANLSQQPPDQIRQLENVERTLEELAKVEQTEAVRNLGSSLQQISEQGMENVIFNEILSPRTPKFLYFDEYYQMKGQDNLDALGQRNANNELQDADHPLLGLIDLAGLNLEQLISPRQTELLIARLEAAGNRLTDKVLKYWSQNKHLLMRFDIRQALPGDPPGMTAGTNIWGLVNDTKHMVSTRLGTRSRGFIWFFSFLAWYSHLRKTESNIILLLDEPGLSLHARAQGDLLAYFEEELKPHHQLVYTTHSPFMVDPGRFDRVRIVQDLNLEDDSDDLPKDQQGTKVITEILDAAADSLFPLQGALGYEMYQALFVGPNCLIVEGVSDLLYIQTVSGILQKKGRESLSDDWTITPVGGADKIPAFLSLIGVQSDLNLAVLGDHQRKDPQKIQELYKRKLLRKKNVITCADYVDSSEADIEDLFKPGFFLDLVNGAFNSSISPGDLANDHPRILRRLRKYMEEKSLPKKRVFNRCRPARYFTEKSGSLEGKLSKQELNRFEEVFKAINALL